MEQYHGRARDLHRYIKDDYLIYGAEAGSKKEKAEKLGIPMLTEQEAMAKING